MEALLKDIVGGKKLSGTKITKLQDMAMKSLKASAFECPQALGETDELLPIPARHQAHIYALSDT